MEEIQQPVTEFLHAFNFNKSRRTYNRKASDGMIHVVNFQVGRYPIGDYTIPGFRENLYGYFTINLGIFLPCVFEAEHGAMSKRVIQEYDCQIRERLGTLETGQDSWWPLEESPKQISSTIVNRLKKFAIPFFLNFTNYESVLSYYHTFDRLPFNPEGRSALIAAIVCHNVGNTESASKLFDKAIGSSNNQGFASYVEGIRKFCMNKDV